MTPPLRVVLADDEAPLRQELAAVLGDEGIEVVAEAADGRVAVTAVVRAQPDVVVMDLRMPRMGGIEATRTIRSLGLRVGVVLLSAYDDEVLERQAREAGADAYLVKGCSATDVLGALRTAAATHHEEVAG